LADNQPSWLIGVRDEANLARRNDLQRALISLQPLRFEVELTTSGILKISSLILTQKRNKKCRPKRSEHAIAERGVISSRVA
jgi:hypothetical protein